jgi:hypothetical protein
MTEAIFQEIERYKKRRSIKNRQENKWLGMFKALVEFEEEFDHSNVPVKYPKDKSLGSWVRRQRLVFHQGKLDLLRQRLLNLINFNYRLLEIHEWDYMIHKLIQFKNQFGHVHITEGHPDVKLYNWIIYQRKLYWKDKLDGDKLSELISMGVDMRNKTLNHWEIMFDKLISFKQEHGHLNVSNTFNKDDQLFNFVKGLRRGKGTISEERREKLDKIGFNWNPGKKVSTMLNKERANVTWLKRLDELKAFKAKYKTCRVLTNSTTHHSLGAWVSKQRNNLEKLNSEQIKMLKDIGFFESNPIHK